MTRYLIEISYMNRDSRFHGIKRNYDNGQRMSFNIKSKYRWNRRNTKMEGQCFTPAHLEIHFLAPMVIAFHNTVRLTFR